MTKASVIVRYDGAALSTHRMEISDLAPALLGMSDLCKLANKKFNGDRAAVQVFIGADQEHQCFQFSLEIVQTIWEQARSLVANDEVKSAKDIFDWLGLIGGTTGSVVGLFKVWKWLENREIVDTKFEVKDGKDVVQISVKGNGNNVIVTHRESYELLKDSVAIASAKKVVEPITKDGYDFVEFETDSTVTEKIDKADANSIMRLSPPQLTETDIDEPQLITAWIKVYSPVYDKGADKWRFQYGDGHPYMNISETDIALKAIERGGALINDTYKVRLEIQQTKNSDGQFSNKYKIKQIIEFHPAQIGVQRDWISNPDGSL